MGESASLLLFYNLIYRMIILHIFAVVNRYFEIFLIFIYFLYLCPSLRQAFAVNLRLHPFADAGLRHFKKQAFLKNFRRITSDTAKICSFYISSPLISSISRFLSSWSFSLLSTIFPTKSDRISPTIIGK